MVVVSLEEWDGVWRRNQHLVSRLLAAQGDVRVLFVEPPSDPLHDLRRGAKVRRARGLRQADLGGADGRLWLFQATKWLPRRLDPWADARLTTATLRAVRRLGMTSPGLWLNDPQSAHLLERTGWPALYDITDDWLLADRSPAEHEQLVENERFLLARCQQVVVCSPRLLETKHAEHVTLVQNAVDLDAYRGDLRRPSDLPTRRVALYVGTLHRDRLDVDLSVELARALAGEATLTFVGPVALDDADRDRLTGAGAVLLGPREHAGIPAYLKNADVLVVPHVVTAFTESLDPIKVYEYLAAGRPVVSTPVAGFRDLVPVASGPDFVDAVRRSLDDGEAPGVADIASWDDRARQMAEVVAGLLRR
jgi:glycosyltransferase involved in cell wall biosynthesis